MTTCAMRALYWAPRILGILLAVFLSLFALDVFGGGYSPLQTIGALLLHLVPTFLVLVALAVAWRWEWIGAVLFGALAVLYLFMTWGRFPLGVYVSVSGPLALTGFLFLLNWIYRAELRAR